MKYEHSLENVNIDLECAIARHSADECAVYKTVAGEPLYLGYYFPKNYDKKKKYSVFFFIHGGGWESHQIFADQKHWQGDYLGYLARYYANKGMICVSLDYRRIREQGQMAGYELIDCYEDCCDAVDYVLKRAEEYGIDRETMYLLGESAGGHLAGAVGTFHYDRKYHFKKVFLINAITDLSDKKWNLRVPRKTAHEKLDGFDMEQRARFLSPLYQINLSTSPVVLIHGEGDTIVSPEHSIKFYRRMCELSNTCDIHMIKNTNHAFLLAEFTKEIQACKIGIGIIDKCLEKNMKVKVYESHPLQNEYYSEHDLEYGNFSEDAENHIINVIDEVKYQEIIGFGGAFTEATAYNYSMLDEKTKKEFLIKYFDREQGIGYNFGRTHINSCDFSLDVYSYVEAGDRTLETFNIERDKQYIIPLLKDTLEVCKEELVLFASPWSPPAYMKTNESALGGGTLKEEYRKIWAMYYAKYIKAYREEGILISAITIQNEPNAIQTWESCVWSGTQERDFIEYDLIPALESEGLSDIKIIIWDHNKERVFERAEEVLSSEVVADKVWAVGHHWYSGEHFEGLALVQEQLNKPNICTEFCAESITIDPLATAERYAKYICQNLNHYMIASCDWNLMLDEDGGPFHNRETEGCYAPILLDRTESKLIFTPTYYYIGHFSKFVKRGAKRIATTRYTDNLYTCAFCNPDGAIVIIVLNPTDEEQTAIFRHQKTNTFYKVQAHSISTIVMEYNNTKR